MAICIITRPINDPHFAASFLMSHFIADDGYRLHVQISHPKNAGTPIVFLHGWTASHAEWTPFLSALEAKHPVYRWDARGHGHNNYTGSPHAKDHTPTVARMARDLHNLILHYELEKVVTVGHSMGALITWQYIRDFGTERLEKVCLIDQSPRLLTDDEWANGIYGDFDAKRSERLTGHLRADFPEAVLHFSAMGLNTRAREKYLENASGWERARQALALLQPDPLIACWESLVAADYRDVLEHIDVPALLVYGGESNFYHDRTAHYVAEKIPQAVLQIYEGTDHSPHQWQRERFAQELLAFIEV